MVKRNEQLFTVMLRTAESTAIQGDRVTLGRRIWTQNPMTRGQCIASQCLDA